ncbi:hypothetical protein [Bradyrhizobium sp. 141]|uniref:hypothetical protein n=1 Tax=Bradyrhizobium sp. 141 TaxID=2782617 RepID=UPI001FF8B6D9|nr:hypothetical protein [Bradyrhizobium sp. 141]MCK1718235.1 hypothetical protein [Bradyrhizobium sp. 141]
MGVDLAPKGREPNLTVPAACCAAAEDQITFDEFDNNGITIVNAIAKSVHFYSRGLRSQLRRSRIGFPASSMDSRLRQCRKRVGLFFERLDPGDVFGEPTHAKWEPARRPEELFVQSPFLHGSEQGSSTWREYQIASRLKSGIHETLAGSYARGDAHNQRHRIADVFCLARSRSIRFASRDHGEW